MNQHVTPLARVIAVMLAAALASGSGYAQNEVEEYVKYLRPRPLPADVTPRVAIQQCGQWVGFYGPIDYRTAHERTKRRVESYHLDEYLPRFLAWPAGRPFDHNVAANLSYTLRAFPNHPLALSVMEQIGRRLKVEDIPGSNYPLECWYLRALQTVPDDPMARGQYGIYLAYRGRKDEARYNLDIADKGLCMFGPMQYHIGLANLALGDYERAQKNALRAERRGFQLPNLRKRIEKSGKWNPALVLTALEVDCEAGEALPVPGAKAIEPGASEASASAPR